MARNFHGKSGVQMENKQSREDRGADGRVGMPSETDWSRESAEDKVFAPTFIVGRDQSYKGGRKVVRLRGQGSD